MWASLLVGVIGAGGDYMILLILVKEKPSTLVKDHPTLAGCVVYRTR